MREEIQEKKKTVTVKQKLFQAAYFNISSREVACCAAATIGTEEEGSMNDIIIIVAF